MIDGTYQASLKTLFGTQKGTVTLVSDGPVCHATVTAAGTVQKADGTVQGDRFSFDGKTDSPFGPISFRITGTADGKTLQATAKTRIGTLKVTGARV